jgi:LmbE family N-acetylglucosaminyl deacetylase
MRLTTIRDLAHRLRPHPRAIVDSFLSYPRFFGTIKPELLKSAPAEFEARLKSLRLSWWPKVLDCPLGRRILLLAPHPDDEAIGAGGFLLRHRGIADIFLINLFNGEDGGRLASDAWRDDAAYKSELVLERRREFEESARRLNATIAGFLDLPDGQRLPTVEDARRLRTLVDSVRPDVILLPWLLDRQRDHRVTNVLYAWGCRDLECAVLGYEIWDLLHPNAMLDIGPCLNEKLELIRIYRTQTATIDYVSMSESLARLRAFTNHVRPDHSGAVEAFLALPNRDYCDLVLAMYGSPGALGDASVLF